MIINLTGLFKNTWKTGCEENLRLTTKLQVGDFSFAIFHHYKAVEVNNLVISGQYLCEEYSQLNFVPFCALGN